jgi:hypothetical protein
MAATLRKAHEGKLARLQLQVDRHEESARDARAVAEKLKQDLVRTSKAMDSSKLQLVKAKRTIREVSEGMTG